MKIVKVYTDFVRWSLEALEGCRLAPRFYESAPDHCRDAHTIKTEQFEISFFLHIYTYVYCFQTPLFGALSPWLCDN